MSRRCASVLDRGVPVGLAAANLLAHDSACGRCGDGLDRRLYLPQVGVAQPAADEDHSGMLGDVGYVEPIEADEEIAAVAVARS